MVPESHEIAVESSEELSAFLASPDFNEVRDKLKQQYEVDARLATENTRSHNRSTESLFPLERRLVLAYTRNNAGGLKDAIDFLISRLVAHGLDASTVKGAIPRPKSDSFEDSLPFFESKLLQNAPLPLSTDSPTRSTFNGDEASERGSLFERLRKPGSMSSFSSLIGRKNQDASPGSFFKHASSNASKASLVSMESRDSGYRNPWNDSGVNLPEEDTLWPTTRFDSMNINSNKFSYGGTPGDTTPRHDHRASFDSGRPSTSNSTSGLYPAPIGPPQR